MTKKIKALKEKLKIYNIDGYVVPKNDDYFTEYSKINRLKIISKFSGSAGLAIILKNKRFAIAVANTPWIETDNIALELNSLSKKGSKNNAKGKIHITLAIVTPVAREIKFTSGTSLVKTAFRP